MFSKSISSLASRGTLWGEDAVAIDFFFNLISALIKVHLMDRGVLLVNIQMISDMINRCHMLFGSLALDFIECWCTVLGLVKLNLFGLLLPGDSCLCLWVQESALHRRV